MSRRDDVNRLYKAPGILDGIEKVLFIIDVVASVVALSNNPKVVSVVIIIQIVSAVLYFLSSVIDDGYFWYEAEKARRKNCIENGLGTRLSELETEDYYNNQSKVSLEKYALNALESNMFSKEIAGKMILWSCIKSVVAIAVLVVACRFLPDSELLLIIAQTAFSSYVLIDTVELVFYKLRMENLYKEGYTALISPGIKGKCRNAVLLAYAVEYEAIKAHYKVRLDEKIFKKNNDKLSEKWNQVLTHRVK